MNRDTSSSQRVAADSSLLGWEDASLGKNLLMFRRIIIPSSLVQAVQGE